jgi:hypothetical protein
VVAVEVEAGEVVEIVVEEVDFDAVEVEVDLVVVVEVGFAVVVDVEGGDVDVE